MRRDEAVRTDIQLEEHHMTTNKAAKTKIVAEPGTQQITLTREFDAPRELVYRAYTDPDLLVQWMGPKRLTMTVERHELRDGGRYRYIHYDDNGFEAGFHGVFHGEPSLVDGVVRTFEFEGYSGHVSLETLTLEERDGKTLSRAVSVFQSVADRDGMIASGMESGVNEGMEKLDELLARLQAEQQAGPAVGGEA
jgi:uncharacterized protein YndB with AHSA1/START domain